MKTIRLILLITIIAIIMLGCSSTETNNQVGGESNMETARKIEVGGLYATKNREGMYLVTKVLVVDEVAVHVRIYANKFTELPKAIDSSVLKLGGLNDKDGFGIGHAPMAKEGFWLDSPVLLKIEPVVEKELEGYRYYLDAMKGGQ